MTIHLHQKFLDDGALPALRLPPRSLLSQITTFWNHETIPKHRITIFGFNFDVLKTSFLGQTETSSQNKPPFWPGRKRGCLGYRGCFFSNFYKSDFSIFACNQIRRVGCLKSEIFKHPSCRYLPIVKCEKLDFKNPKFTNIRLFDIRLQPTTTKTTNIKMRCKIQVLVFSFWVKIKRTDDWTFRLKH